MSEDNSTISVAATRKRGGGAAHVFVKLDGRVLPFDEGSDEAKLDLELAQHASHKLIIVVVGPDGANGEIRLVDTRASEIYDLTSQVEGDVGIDHSDGSFDT